ncbi:MAG: flagellar hook-basal body complex protein [Butyrivibrio sp.]|uniref:flagellar hook-basal body complex protein n=1 Tax=Butyrivibrio sp. TaxID=28121 RepID=UPI0025C3098C|nr:flagellar hook-basal body complex protein [Butyrivibrio sp.]MBQ6587957.1 flagellar hook-basal body complex protein [Butyrivibrio sp.]
MMRSLYSGVAGLKTHQTKMDVIGNNIANVNTTSFKSQSITFSDLMYQTTQTASGATETKGGVNARQIGLGAKSGAINTAITSQGATQTTNNPFDIMITGEAFFIVNNGNENLYTRDGSFYVDGAGNLAMQSNGYFVQGWVAQEDKDTDEITINKNAGLSALQIMSADNNTYSPASTTAGLFSGNIDDNDTNILSDDGKTITMEFYDNKGYLYTGKFVLKDTETDHLFALTLTDIIDSSGNSIGQDLLSHITLGNVDSDANTTAFPAKDGYTFQTDATGTVFSINAPGGDVKYGDVPNSADGKNTLGDLMSTSSKKYKGLLNAVYGVTEDEEKTYGSSATYLIDTTSAKDSEDYGKITIKYSKNDIPDEENSIDGSYATAKFKFITNTTNSYYFVNGTTKEAYLVPSPSSGDVSKLTKDYLKTVFGIPSASSSFNFDTDKDLYTYSYDSTTDPESMILQRKVDLATANSETTYATSTLVTKSENQYFVNTSDSTKTLLADIASKGYDPANLTYKYNATSKKLTLFGAKLEDTTSTDKGSIQINKTDTTASNYVSDLGISYLNSFITAYNAAQTDDTKKIDTTKLKVADLTSMDTYIDSFVDTDPSITGESDSSQAAIKLMQMETGAKNAITKIKSLVTDRITALSDNTSAYYDSSYTSGTNKETFNFSALTGSEGMILTYPVKALGPSTEIGQYTIMTADKGTLNTDYTKQSPSNAKYIYKAYDEGIDTNVYKKAYSLGSGLTGTFTDTTLTDTYESLLLDVFSSNKGVQDFMGNMTAGQQYIISFDQSTGEVSIAHTEERIIKQPSGSEYTIVDNGNGSINITSTSVYKDVPSDGDISSLLRTATGNTQDLLYKIYGITDEMADAFGTDGQYKITNDGSIKLTIGDHSIQLSFKAANGALDKADGTSTGLVTMNFNQKIPGLEAFGYQEESDQHNFGDINFDFSTLTNYNTNGSSTIKAVKGDKKSLNTGRAVGEMNGVSVSTDGQIYATYSNGQTKLLGQIASAEFANASGLSKEGDNLYASTLNSGEATVQDITTDGGYMNTGVLEMSNVDLSSQFTEMITTQRGFQANSRIITVSDTLLEELTNLKR